MEALDEIKQEFADIADTYRLKGKSQAQIYATGAYYKRELLAEAVFKLYTICEKSIQLAESAHDDDSNTILINQIKDVICQTVPNMINKALEKESVIEDSSTGLSEHNDSGKHVVLLEDENVPRFDKNGWNDVVKNSINGKLKNIPVKKSLVNKEGKGVLIFPTEEDQNQAKQALESDFKVTLSYQERRLLLPKLKVANIDGYSRNEKLNLKRDILEKNYVVEQLVNQDHHFEVMIIDEKFKYAVLKVSPEIRNALLKQRSLYIGMQSHPVKDHIHLMQCYRCQEHGHKAGSDECKLKNGDPVCLYCGGNHFSRSCTQKDNPAEWKCSNCLNSKNINHRLNASGHKTTSLQCPVAMNQMKAVIGRTKGLQVKNFLP